VKGERMRLYETVFILDPKLEENEVSEEIGKVRDLITRLGGEIVKVEEGGKRKLAYEIKRNKEGYYVLIVFRSDPSCIAEIERSYRLNEKVLRHIIIVATEKKIETQTTEMSGEA